MGGKRIRPSEGGWEKDGIFIGKKKKSVSFRRGGKKMNRGKKKRALTPKANTEREGGRGRASYLFSNSWGEKVRGGEREGERQRYYCC